MAAKVSVIVPVYNVEAYLSRCLDSIQVQTFSDFEALLINDGSTDGSNEICKTYQNKDSRFRLVEKQNGGLSSARNKGLEEAVGKFVAFVDSDDSLHPQMLEKLIDTIQTINADMAICDYFNVYNGDAKPQYGRAERFICNGQEAYSEMLQGLKTGASACTRLFRRASIGELRFQEGIICEDAEFHSRLMPNIETVAFNLEPLYYYHHRKNSISTHTFNEKTLDTVKVYEKVFERATEHFPALLPQATFRLEWAHFFVLDQMLLEEDYRHLPGYQEIIHYLKHHAIASACNPWFKTSRRVAALALRFSVSLYRFLLLKNMRRTWGGA